MAAMMGSKTISCLHWIRDTDRGGFFRDRKMQHTASGLLPDKQFSDAFLKRSDSPHPPVNLETLLFRGCHACSLSSSSSKSWALNRAIRLIPVQNSVRGHL